MQPRCMMHPQYQTLIWNHWHMTEKVSTMKHLSGNHDQSLLPILQLHPSFVLNNYPHSSWLWDMEHHRIGTTLSTQPLRWRSQGWNVALPPMELGIVLQCGSSALASCISHAMLWCCCCHHPQQSLALDANHCNESSWMNIQGYCLVWNCHMAFVAFDLPKLKGGWIITWERSLKCFFNLSEMKLKSCWCRSYQNMRIMVTERYQGKNNRREEIYHSFGHVIILF